MPVRPTETDYFLTWLWFFLCATVGGIAAGGIVGAMIGAVVGPIQVSRPPAVYVILGVSLLASAVVSYVFFRFFVKRLVVRAQETPKTPQDWV